MEQLGGLIRRMPQTAFAFLAGCVAISALPPLNGFVSEWLTFQAILLSPQFARLGAEAARSGRGRAARAVGGAGCGLLRQGVRHHLPRSTPLARGGRRARDRPPSRGPPCSCSSDSASRPASCPDSSSTRSRRRSAVSSARACPCRPRKAWLTIVPIAAARSSYNGLLVLLFIAAVGRPLRRWRSISSPRARSAGRPPGTAARRTRAPVHQYTAASFAQPIRRVFGALLFGAREVVDMPAPGELRAGEVRGDGPRPGLGRNSTPRSPRSSVAQPTG